MTISDGLKKLTTLASIWPTRRPASVSSSRATGSPNAAARATSSAVTAPRSSSAARQPPAPSRHRGGPALQRRARTRPRAPRGSRRSRTGRRRERSSTTWMWPDVSRAALRAPVEAPVRDDPGADARPDLDDDDVVVALRDPGPPLAEGEDVDVVVDPDRRAEPLREPLPDRVAVPARHDRRRDRPAGRELHGAGHRDADAPHRRRRPGATSRGAVGTAPPRGPGSRSGPVGDVGGLGVARRGSGRERSVRATAMLVAPRSATRTWPLAARNARCRGGRPPVLGPSSPSVISPRSMSSWTRRATIGATQPCPRDELRARPGPPVADLVQHDHERVEDLLRQRLEGGLAGLAGHLPGDRRVRVHGADATPASTRDTTTFAVDRSKYAGRVGCGNGPRRPVSDTEAITSRYHPLDGLDGCRHAPRTGGASR